VSIFLGVVDESNLEEGYDKYIWSDSCCFEGIEWCEQNGFFYDTLTITNLNSKEIYERYRYLDNIRKELVEYATCILNEYLSTDYKVQKWETMLSSALINLIPSLYDKYLKFKYAINMNESMDVHLYNTDSYDVPLDYYDLMFLINEDNGYHRLLCSLMFPLIKGSELINAKYTIYSRDKFKRYTGEIPQYVREFIDEYYGYKEQTNELDEVVIQSSLIKFTLYKQIIENKYGKITGYFYNYYTELRNNLSWDVDYKWRNTERCDIPNTEDEFLTIMYRLLPKILPIAYVEDFHAIRECALNNYKWGKKPNAIICDATEVHSDEMFKTYLMDVDRNISKLVGIQHAGFYGFGGDIWGKKFELSQYDEFFGTGCYSDVFDNTKIIQMPLVTMFRMPIISLEKNRQKILFLNASWPKNNAGLVTKQCDFYIKDDVRFLKGLRKDILNNIVIRYYPFSGFGYDIENSFRNEIKSIRFDDNDYLYDSLQDTQLLISSSIGTSVLESMRAGIPTVMMMNPQLNDHVLSKCSEDLDIINRLIEADLLAGSPERLDDIVNSMYDRIDEWWNEPKRQRLVEELLDRYVFMSEDADGIWIDKICQYTSK